MKIQLIDWNWHMDCTPVLTIQAFVDNECEVI